MWFQILHRVPKPSSGIQAHLNFRCSTWYLRGALCVFQSQEDFFPFVTVKNKHWTTSFSVTIDRIDKCEWKNKCFFLITVHSWTKYGDFISHKQQKEHLWLKPVKKQGDFISHNSLKTPFVTEIHSNTKQILSVKSKRCFQV